MIKISFFLSLYFLCVTANSQVILDFCHKNILTENNLVEIKRVLEVPLAEEKNVDAKGLSRDDLFLWAPISNSIRNSGILVQNLQYISWLHQSKKDGKKNPLVEFHFKNSFSAVFNSLSSLEKVVRATTPNIQDSRLARISMDYRSELSKINTQLEICK
jgi:hypothetical protein